MNSSREINFDLNSVKQIGSKRRAAGWVPTQSTLAGKVILGLVCLVVIGGVFAAIIVPFLTAKEVTTTTTVTTTSQTTATVTTTTATSTTSTSMSTSSATTTSVTTITSTSTSTSSTTTTTPRYPISCYSTVTASNFYSGAGTPTAQEDGLVDRPNTSGGTYFNSGGNAPQWFQLQFPGYYNITRIALLVNQSPNGVTQQQISAGPTVASLQLVTNFTSYTSSGQWINITYNPILTNVEFVRVTTVSSPSWVAWSKCYVYDY